MTATSTQWLGDSETKPAPEGLRRVQAFINTIDRESGEDRLATAQDARPFLVKSALLEPDVAVTNDDLRTITAFREGLRALVIHNTDGRTPNPAMVTALHEIVEQEPVRAVFVDDGTLRMAPAGDGLRARLLGLLLDIADAQRDGTWKHMKACANEDCLWAFYDRSRNHGGTWCDMATCGNKLKNRDFRARKRTAD